MKKKFIFAVVMAYNVTMAIGQNNTAAAAYPPLNVDSFAVRISQQTKPQIIDVRTPEEFAINHINDAINIDLRKANYLEDLTQLEKNKPVFIYAIQNYRPGLLSKELREKGYAEVYELKSGIASWIGSGRPYYSSAKNMVSLTEYKKLIADHRLVLVDIGTKYCGACVKVNKIVDSLKTENNNAYEILQLDLYNNHRLAADLKEIQSVPTLLFYKEGKLIWKKTGLTFTKGELSDAIAKVK